MRECRDDGSCAARFVGRLQRSTREDAATAWRLAGSFRIERTGDRDALDVRQTEMIGGNQRGPEKRLQAVSAFSRRLLQKRDADPARTGLRKHPHLQAG